MNRNLYKALIVLLVFAFSAAGQSTKPQQAQAVDAPPLSYGFVVDNSGSYRHFLERIITMIKTIADTNNEKDEAFLLTFVDNAKTSVRQEFTGNVSELKDAAENMFIEGGLTSVLDAVRLSIDYLSANAKAGDRKRALLLISDGDDISSAAKIETVVAAAKNANVRIYVVGMSEDKLNTKLLDRLAKETGGRVFYPKTPKDAVTVTTEVVGALRGN